MSVLSDWSIRSALVSGRLAIDPLARDAIQPSSVDLRLGEQLLVWNEGHRAFRPANQSETGDCWWLEPGRLYLGVTHERITLPADLQGQLNGLSSNARNGITIHQTGGFVDPGWDGHLTLEISVLRERERLWPGMRIAQIAFYLLDQPCERPYGANGFGRYQGDTEPTPARRSHK